LPTKVGEQRHHILPYNLRNEQLLKDIGYDATSKENMIYLPSSDDGSGRTIHRGKHLKSYDDNWRDVLADIQDDLDAGDINAQEARQRVKSAVEQTRGDLQNGRTPLNKAGVSNKKLC